MAWTNPTTWTTGQVPGATGTVGFNVQIRDNLNAVGSHEWSTWAPALTGSVTNPAVASAAGQYARPGNLVVAAYKITMGSTVGEGDYSVSLPVNGNFGNDHRPGHGYLYDASTYRGWVTCHYSTSTDAATVKIMWNAKTANGVVTHASPAGWGSNDLIAGQLIYRAAT